MSADNNSWIGSPTPEGDDERASEALQPPSTEQPAERAVPGWLAPPAPEHGSEPPLAAPSGPEVAPAEGGEPSTDTGPEAQADAEPEAEPESGAEPEPAAIDEPIAEGSTPESDVPADDASGSEPEPVLSEEEAAAAAAATVPAAQARPGDDLDGEVQPLPEAREIDLGPDGGARWWVWALAILAVVAIASAVGYVWWYRTARPIAVPDIAGKQPAEATQILNDLSLRLGAVSEIPTDSAPAGTIVSQKPKAGTTLSPGGNVAFAVATLPDQAKVPDTVGKSQETAEVALVTARLLPVIVTSYSATTGEGTVVGQVPTPGVELSPGTQVVLVVSRGPAPNTTTVPRLTGLTEGEATKLLSANHLSAVFYRSIDASIPAGDVISQSPLARASAPYDSVVQVLVSQGPGTVSATVPNVVGETKKDADSRLEARGLKSLPRGEPSATVAKGRVISQMPPSGRKVAPGASVGILVSTGPVATVPVPELTGMSANVTETISGAGFKPVVVTIKATGQNPGAVFAQYPQVGTPYLTGLPLVALIAAAP